MRPSLVTRARLILLLGLCCATAAGVTRADDRPKAAVPAPLPPADALRALKTPADLVVEQVLAEPLVRQPVFLNFDERGRMWVIQYLQYPHPAGLTMLSHDGVWRAVYDKVPPPPPHHFRGDDKITIHEDTDGDGVFDHHKTFLEGLNIVTAVARGRGGVWVLNPPYLLFYPDRNNDDVPDADPEVRLEGFGLEDTHSVANSLCWGPDGWLYAAQGSTVTGNVRRPGGNEPPVHSMGQLIWRYHPELRRYEVFAEGGGNAFGVEIDSKGRIFSGHNGGDTRGFHYVQGGYFQKGFGKHGPLSNPYTFGYFPAMKHNAVPRFTHTFVIEEGGALPEQYHGKLFGAAPLLNHVVLSDVLADGSSIKTRDIGYALTSTDTWFRPVDIKSGPDGAIYVADWYDRQANHFRNHEGQIDKTTGRIYRIKTAGAGPFKAQNLAELPTGELVDRLLESPNRWTRQTALRLIADRKDGSIAPRLLKALRDQTGQPALEALWALNLVGAFDDRLALDLLGHDDPYVRIWAVRLACDKKDVSPDLAKGLAARAKTEPNVEVRSQLACSARRLPAEPSLALLRELLSHSEDGDDIHIPLLLWWGIESKVTADRDAVLALFRSRDIWNLPIVKKSIAERLMRRLAASGTRADLLACVALLKLAPGPEDSRRLMTGFEAALAGRALPDLPAELAEAMSRFGGGSVLLGLRRGDPPSVDEALKVIADARGDRGVQLQYIQVLGQTNRPSCVPVLLTLATSGTDPSLRGAALGALARYDDSRIAPQVVQAIPGMSDDVRGDAFALLASRPSWAIALLASIDAGKIDPVTVPAEAVQRIRMHQDAPVVSLARKIWGEARATTPAELQKEIERLELVVRGGSGIPKPGKALFAQRCARCHTLFGEGGKVGPELTAFRRDDLATMLLSIINPSAEIREGYASYLVATGDGRTLTGSLVEQDTQRLVLRGADGRDVSLRRDEVDDMKPSAASLMPEGLTKDLTDQQIRDLFAYLRSSQPLID